MAYDSTALRQSLSRLGVNPDGVVEGGEPTRRIRVMDVLMLEREALLRAYLGGASVTAIYKTCKQHGLIACCAPTFYASFNSLLDLAQVPRRPRVQAINAKRRLILKPGVARLLVEMRPLFAQQPAAQAPSAPATARPRRGAGKAGERGKSSVPMSIPGVGAARTVAPAVRVPAPAGAATGSLDARGPLDRYRDNLRTSG
jgi:hypothetical protein